MKHFRRISLVFLLIGISILIVGFVKHPGIPYQDPTQEMLNIYNQEAKRSEEIQSYGLSIFLVSFGAFLMGKIIDLFRGRNKNKGNNEDSK
ncbi:hypothetical protein Back11_57680 [Paenibacillus baekrokdamisoli]|uniref:Uncharacterized protein n=2 Tax=Paenibacillus baekrokdamisoli TaxID=1712516 RepID=A0A3G9JHH8_9BACL|nr:hypothetical protein [Paenibacillus baekrokdamisoli]BBH24423.1 hypothetical protein Back11_57680 [Paenibacillus baekrokdamisoli]